MNYLLETTAELWQNQDMQYKLYSAPLRSRLEIRSVYLEASAETTVELKNKRAWKYQAAAITDENGAVVEDNGL